MSEIAGYWKRCTKRERAGNLQSVFKIRKPHFDSQASAFGAHCRDLDKLQELPYK